MASFKISPSKPKLRAGCNCSFESWLSTQNIKLEEQKRLIKEWQALPIQRGEQGFLRLAAAAQWSVIRYGPTTPPKDVSIPVPIFSDVGDIFTNKELLDATLKWMKSILQPYAVQP